MNRQVLETIYAKLEKAIDAGYKAGIKSIVEQNKQKRRLFTFAKPKSPAFSLDYTLEDLDAINNFKMNAFRVAGVGSYDLEEELKELGVELMKSGLPDFDEFDLAVREKFMKYGVGLGDQPPSGWIKQNIDTAIKSSRAGARWNRVNDPDVSGVYTHWTYMTQLDASVREEHAKLHGLTFRIDDSSASRLIPPLDWGCRCYESYITGTEAEGYVTPNDEQVQELLNEVPEDFRYNPGDSEQAWQHWIDQKYAGMPEGKKNEIEKMVKEKFS